MPRTVAVSWCVTRWRMRLSPSARTVSSCFGERPIIERTSVILSVLLATSRLLRARAVPAAPHRVLVLQALDPPERVDRRLEDVVRVVRAERLGQDVLHARRLEDRPYRAPRDDARARDRGLEEHAPGAEVPRDLAGNRRVPERHEDEVLLGVLHGLADRLRHLVGLP